MSPKIHAEFWTDPELDNAEPEVRLVLLWMITNPMTDITGTFELNPRRFKFETNLEPQWLQNTLDAVPRMFVRCGSWVWLRTFIKHQFGQGEKLARNKMGSAVARAALDLPVPLREAVWGEYPELKGLASPSKGSPSPSKGLASPSELPLSSHSEAHAIPIQSPPDGVRTETGIGTSTGTESGEGTGEGARAPGLGGNGALVESWVEKPAVGMRFDLAKECLDFLNEKTGSQFQPVRAVLEEIALRLIEVNGDVAGVKAMIARQAAVWAPPSKMARFLRPQTLFECQKFHGYFGQRGDVAAVDSGETEARVKKLRELIEKSPANSESAWHSSEATEPEKLELKKWRKELGQIKKPAADLD